MLEIIVQSLIVAAIVAGATGYVSGRVMEVKINGLRETIQRLEARLEQVAKRVHDLSRQVGAVEANQVYMAKELERRKKPRE